MRLTWLPAVLRAAGLTVHSVDGWERRGADSFGPVRGITVHHTAGSRTSTIAGEIRVLLNGSETAPAPISQLFLARNGDWHVIAAGLCFHNLIGWGGPNRGYGNDSLLGIEAQHSGGTEPWTTVQYQSYVRGVAALVRHKAAGWDVTVARVAGHKEHQPGAKSDPTFDMGRFRADVTLALKPVPVEVKMVTVAGMLPVLKQGMTDPVAGANYIWRLQLLLGVDADGDYGPATAVKVKAYNKTQLSRVTDGKSVDAAMWTRLLALKPAPAPPPPPASA